MSEELINEVKTKMGVRTFIESCRTCKYSKLEVLPSIHCNYNPSVPFEVTESTICNHYKTYRNE